MPGGRPQKKQNSVRSKFDRRKNDERSLQQANKENVQPDSQIEEGDLVMEEVTKQIVLLQHWGKLHL